MTADDLKSLPIGSVISVGQATYLKLSIVLGRTFAAKEPQAANYWAKMDTGEVAHYNYVLDKAKSSGQPIIKVRS